MIKLPWREYNMSIRYGQKSPYVLRRYGPVKSRCLSVILDHDQIFLLQLHHVTSCHSTLSVELKKVQFSKSQQHHDTTKKNNAVRQGSSCWNKTKSQSARDSHFSDFSFDSMTNCALWKDCDGTLLKTDHSPCKVRGQYYIMFRGGIILGAASCSWWGVFGTSFAFGIILSKHSPQELRKHLHLWAHQGPEIDLSGSPTTV